MKNKIPSNVIEILNKIESAGFEAFIVGGAVRDLYLNKTPKDWDITTNAKPEEIKRIFNKTLDIGEKFGTITAMVNNEWYEITTYRIDGEYKDNRKPDNVIFTNNLIDDLKRRDLTFNAMAMDKNGKITDNFNGINDLKNGIVRSVGDPDKRIKEDALRMLRAIRFSAKYNYNIDENLKKAIRNNSKLINNVSFERIENELSKILTSDHPEKFVELYNLGITKEIMPEFDNIMECKQNNPHHIYSVGMHTIKSIESIENDKVLRWAMLLHDIGKPITKTTDENGIDHFYKHPYSSTEISKQILKKFKFTNKETKEILNLVFHHDLKLEKESKIRCFIAENGIDFINKLIKVQIADISAQNPKTFEEKKEKIDIFKNKCVKIEKEKSAITLRNLEISGNELLKIGFKGKEIGETLKELLNEVLEYPEKNNKETLYNIAYDIFNKNKTLDEIILNNTEKNINNKNPNIDEQIK